jgi:accessory colonization factor AcfC
VKTCLFFRHYLEHNFGICVEATSVEKNEAHFKHNTVRSENTVEKSIKSVVFMLSCGRRITVLEGCGRANGVVQTFTWRDLGKRQGTLIKVASLRIFNIPSTSQTSVGSEVRSCFPAEDVHLNVCELL